MDIYIIYMYIIHVDMQLSKTTTNNTMIMIHLLYKGSVCFTKCEHTSATMEHEFHDGSAWPMYVIYMDRDGLGVKNSPNRPSTTTVQTVAISHNIAASLSHLWQITSQNPW